MNELAPSPPFLFTYWNPFSEDSSLAESWFSYVKNVSLAKYTADTVGRYMEQASSDQIQAIHSTGQKICGVIYDGLSELQNQLGGVQGQLSGVQEQLGDVQGLLGNVQGQLQHVSRQVYQVCIELQGVNQRLSLLLDEARTSNVLQQNIAELMRIPDSQKQRQYHVELGLKFLKNARRDEDLYQDALRELVEAEKLMQTDYFILHRIGLIYLYVPALGNLEKALDYLVRAAKYAFVESDPNASRLSNVLNKNVNTRFAQQAEPAPGDVSSLAAESYHEAGTALYALGRYDEAVALAEKAVKCQAGVGKYRFFLAKYQARLEKTDSAVQQLQKAIEVAPELAVATVGDFDLNRSQAVLDLLEALNADVNLQLTDVTQRLEKWVETNSQSGDTDVPKWIISAKESLQTGTYSQKRELLEKFNNYDDATLATLPACSKIMASLNEDFIGQERIKKRLTIAANTAVGAWNEMSTHPQPLDWGFCNSQPLGHILLLGPIGAGKSKLADALAKTMKQFCGERMEKTLCVSDSGFLIRPVILQYVKFDSSKVNSLSDLAELLDYYTFGELRNGISSTRSVYILFVDEIHKLQPHMKELLCRAMKSIFIKGTEWRQLGLFTLIATAPSIDQLPFECLSAFSIVECLDPYSHDEQILLARRFAGQLGIDPEAAVKALDGRDYATPQDIYMRLLKMNWSQGAQNVNA